MANRDPWRLRRAYDRYGPPVTGDLATLSFVDNKQRRRERV